MEGSQISELDTVREAFVLVPVNSRSPKWAGAKKSETTKTGQKSHVQKNHNFRPPSNRTGGLTGTKINASPRDVGALKIRVL